MNQRCQYSAIYHLITFDCRKQNKSGGVNLLSRAKLSPTPSVLRSEKPTLRETFLPCHSERSVSGVELFPPRSRMALRTFRSSLRSDFDYAQDDTVEKAQGISRSGISAGQRKKAANLTPFGTPNGNRSRLRARSLRGSDMPPACHSLPLRLRFPW